MWNSLLITRQIIIKLKIGIFHKDILATVSLGIHVKEINTLPPAMYSTFCLDANSSYLQGGEKKKKKKKKNTQHNAVFNLVANPEKN